MQATHEKVGCVDAATEVLGDKWTPRLLRYFMNEDAVRFCKIQDYVGGINPRTLSARLAHMEESGIIEKVAIEEAGHACYRLTQKGVDLLPILADMQAWSDKYANT
jgi:DNA-binding HxlR family transcriptional regulator